MPGAAAGCAATGCAAGGGSAGGGAHGPAHNAATTVPGGAGSADPAGDSEACGVAGASGAVNAQAAERPTSASTGAAAAATPGCGGNGRPAAAEAAAPGAAAFGAGAGAGGVISHKLRDYEVVSTIGKGQFGIVQKIRPLRPEAPAGVFLVWKKIRYAEMREKERRQLAQEVQLLQALSHPNVVRYVGKINDKPSASLYLIMEYCEGGDLARYLEHTVKKEHFFAESQIFDWYRQLVDALEYCHSRPEGKVLHRDLKPQNILLTQNKSRLKFADFGLAKVLQPEQAMTQTHVGTPYYMSPEVLSREQYGEKSDIWSLGCLLFEIMTGTSPFFGAASYQDLCDLVRGRRIAIEKVPPLYCSELLDVIRKTLAFDEAHEARADSSVPPLQPADRPTASDLKTTLVYRHATLARRCSGVERSLTAKTEALARAAEAKRVAAVAEDGLGAARKHLARLEKEMSFLEDYVQFQLDSDEAIRRSLRLLLPPLPPPQRKET